MLMNLGYLANVMSASNLPPLRNLPNWSRVGTLDKARYPRLFLSDCVPNASGSGTQKPILQKIMDSDVTRVASLEKDIVFLQHQHKDTLERLHSEIDSLKRENKELQYRLIMEPRKEFSKSQHQTAQSNCGSPHTQPLRSHLFTSYSCQNSATSSEASGRELRGGTITSLFPLRIHNDTSQLPRAPTLQECEVIIQQLCSTNSTQSQELLRVKALLKNVVSNKKKLTPEVHPLKAYLVDSSRGEESEQLPRLPLKPLPMKLPSIQPSPVAQIVLPAIKQNLSSTVTERQRRACDCHKTRLRRAVN